MMQALVIVTHAALIAGLIVLAALYWRLQRRAQALERLAGGLQPPASTPATAGAREPREAIAIEILNPLEVAARESRFAGVLGTLTPTLLRREVYRQARNIIEQELKGRGIEADVQVRRVG